MVAAAPRGDGGGRGTRNGGGGGKADLGVADGEVVHGLHAPLARRLLEPFHRLRSPPAPPQRKRHALECGCDGVHVPAASRRPRKFGASETRVVQDASGPRARSEAMRTPCRRAARAGKACGAVHPKITGTNAPFQSKLHVQGGFEMRISRGAHMERHTFLGSFSTPCPRSQHMARLYCERMKSLLAALR
jgi:hypothetical protein